MGRKMLNSQNTIVKAIGIPQPHAWLVMNGYLNRVPAGEYTGHHGQVLVYALPQSVTERAYRPVVIASPDEPIRSKTKWRHWTAKIRDGVQEHIVPEAGKIARELKEAALAGIRERIRARIHRFFAGGRRKRR